MSWREGKIGDLVTLQRGHDLTDADRKPGEVPVVGAAGLNGFHETAKTTGAGVVVGRSGGSIGKVTYVDRAFWPHNTCLYVKDFKGNHPRFVAYLLSTLNLSQLNSGAAQPSLNRNFVHPVRIRFPSPQEQAHLADILSAYDDLIENNQRRIQLLEQAARLLYKEWFVHLRFPGHEHVKITDGVPNGWKPMTLGDICVEIRETVRPDQLNPNTPYIGLEHIPRRSISLTEWGTAEQVTSSKHRFQENDILFGKIRPYFHKVGIAFVDGVASSDAIVLRPHERSAFCLALMTVSSDSFVAVTAQTMKEGSKMPRADWKQMQAYPVLLPPASILDSFDAFIHAIVLQLKSLVFANQRLFRARDLLLPRLMNGEIPV